MFTTVKDQWPSGRKDPHPSVPLYGYHMQE
jgi:hypothetical protein